MRTSFFILFIVGFAYLCGYSNGINISLPNFQCSSDLHLDVLHQPKIDLYQLSCLLENGEDNDENEEQDENSSKSNTFESSANVASIAYQIQRLHPKNLKLSKMPVHSCIYPATQRYLLLRVLRI